MVSFSTYHPIHNMSSVPIRKIYTLTAPRHVVYAALTQASHISVWTGSPAEMCPEPGEKFSLWDGSIHGVNSLLTEDTVEQFWKEDKWADFSKVTFLLSEADGITTVELIHQDVPPEHHASIDNGWDVYYMAPLKAYVEALPR